MNNVLQHMMRFIWLMLVQGLLISNLHWMGVFHPYIYVLALIMLPATMPRWAEMLIGAALGLCMDTIYTTPGIQMAACVAVAYVRPLLIAHLVQDSRRINSLVCSATMGDWQYLMMMLLMILLHHSMVFILEAWSMHHIWWLLLTTLLSVLITALIGFALDHIHR